MQAKEPERGEPLDSPGDRSRTAGRAAVVPYARRSVADPAEDPSGANGTARRVRADAGAPGARPAAASVLPAARDRHVPADGAVADAAPGAVRFVIAALASCFGVLGAVLALNVIADPFAITGTGVVPTAVESDRGIKLTLVERLDAPPDVLILGSSRARLAEPAFLRRLTGLRGFNAGVTGGTAADAWVFTRHAASEFPQTRRRFIWFVDVGIATNGVNPQLADDPRAARYLESGGQIGLKDVATYLSVDATRASIRVLRKCVLDECVPRIAYEADGSILRSQLRYLPERGRNLKAAAAALAASVRANPPKRVPVDRDRHQFFERTLAFMNSRGERPVIVFNPIYPTVLAALERHGFPGRATSLAYLRELRRRGFDFVLVNLQDIRTWGGRAEDFSNPTHVNRKNMERMLRYIVAHSEGALS